MKGQLAIRLAKIVLSILILELITCPCSIHRVSAQYAPFAFIRKPPAPCTGAGSQTFSYTGSIQTLNIPAGCTTMTISAVGGGGAGNYGYSSSVGYGGGGVSYCNSSVVNNCTATAASGSSGVPGGCAGANCTLPSCPMVSNSSNVGTGCGGAGYRQGCQGASGKVYITWQ